MTEQEVLELKAMWLDRILWDAYYLDDKPHKMFNRIRLAARDCEADQERSAVIQRLCEMAYNGGLQYGRQNPR